MIAFHLPIAPPKATSQSAGKRIMVIKGKPMFFKNKQAQGAENDLLLMCSPHAPQAPMQGPLTLEVSFVFPWRKSETKRRQATGYQPNDTRPDCSNLIKLLEDCMTKLGFWNDDGQIADLRVKKGWGDNVGITVRVEPIECGKGEF